jgi:hypothetical protein
MRNFKWGFSTLGCPGLSLAEASDSPTSSTFRFSNCGRWNIRSTSRRSFPIRKNSCCSNSSPPRDGSGSSAAPSSRLAQNDYEGLPHSANWPTPGIPYLRVFGGFDFHEELGEERIAATKENLARFHDIGSGSGPPWKPTTGALAAAAAA